MIEQFLDLEPEYIEYIKNHPQIACLLPTDHESSDVNVNEKLLRLWLHANLIAGYSQFQLKLTNYHIRIMISC